MSSQKQHGKYCVLMLITGNKMILGNQQTNLEFPTCKFESNKTEDSWRDGLEEAKLYSTKIGVKGTPNLTYTIQLKVDGSDYYIFYGYVREFEPSARMLDLNQKARKSGSKKRLLNKDNKFNKSKDKKFNKSKDKKDTKSKDKKDTKSKDKKKNK